MIDFDSECVFDLDSYPLHSAGSAVGERARENLASKGIFDLEGFLKPEAIARCLKELVPVIDAHAFTHKRRHNIYFRKAVPGLDAGHSALREFETVNHTICADQFADSLLARIYEWPPLLDFLSHAMDKPRLYPMADPLARINVMAYGEGEALNWHFDRSEFTTTLLLQAPQAGGAFEYRTGLRSEADPNYHGVARLLDGQDPAVNRLDLKAGTFTVFKGRNTAHRVSPVSGPRRRIVAVFSYFERPGVRFTDEERIGFYGRAA